MKDTDNLNINQEENILGIVGWPLTHSYSPYIHNFWLNEYSLKYRYKKFPIEPNKLIENFKILKKKNFIGLNVTVPYKEKLLPYMDKLDESAKKIGAINIIFRDSKGSTIGSNSDSYGFIKNLYNYYPNIDIKNLQCAIFGSGGAARAALYSVIKEGAKEVLIFSRNYNKASILASDFKNKCKVLNWNKYYNLMKDIQLLINATPMGMPNIPLVNLELKKLPKNAIVYDLVYSKHDTPLIILAKQDGYSTIGGLGMLLHQAVPSFYKWFDKKPTITDTLTDYIVEKL
ncbi:shikimate dehydrogenase [Alphaproteobacteria bacterium]|nr:shikimate dehydrogenase [Alphaproteobacteria bacterium]